MAGARALWRATGMTDDDFGKPIVAIANSYTQFVPGHVHLKDLGDIVAESIKTAGGVSKEFHTIAVDDGIAMGHGGMLYSLPSRELIADSVEYMVNAHCADALVCISNCDKITPGMLLAGDASEHPDRVRLRRAHGGRPYGRGRRCGFPQAGFGRRHDRLGQRFGERRRPRRHRTFCLPDVRFVLGMFTANSMNCLTEAIGLALPGNGSVLATHSARRDLFSRAGEVIVEVARRYYDGDDESVLPETSPIVVPSTTRSPWMWPWAVRRIRCCTYWRPRVKAASTFPSQTSMRYRVESRVWRRSRRTRPTTTWRTCIGRVGYRRSSASCTRAGLLHEDVGSVHSPSLPDWLSTWDIRNPDHSADAAELFHAAPGGVRTTEPFSTSNRWSSLDRNARRVVFGPWNTPIPPTVACRALRKSGTGRLCRQDRRSR